VLPRGAGLEAAETAADAEGAINQDFRRRIIATPALTAEGLALKGQVAAWCQEAVSDLEGDLARVLEWDGAPADAVTASLRLNLAYLPAQVQA
jgi:hypothetical protein